MTRICVNEAAHNIRKRKQEVTSKSVGWLVLRRLFLLPTINLCMVSASLRKASVSGSTSVPSRSVEWPLSGKQWRHSAVWIRLFIKELNHYLFSCYVLYSDSIVVDEEFVKFKSTFLFVCLHIQGTVFGIKNITKKITNYSFFRRNGGDGVAHTKSTFETSN